MRSKERMAESDAGKPQVVSQASLSTMLQAFRLLVDPFCVFERQATIRFDRCDSLLIPHFHDLEHNEVLQLCCISTGVVHSVALGKCIQCSVRVVLDLKLNDNGETKE